MAKDKKENNHKNEYKNLKEAFNQVQQMQYSNINEVNNDSDDNNYDTDYISSNANIDISNEINNYEKNNNSKKIPKKSKNKILVDKPSNINPNISKIIETNKNISKLNNTNNLVEPQNTNFKKVPNQKYNNINMYNPNKVSKFKIILIIFLLFILLAIVGLIVFINVTDTNFFYDLTSSEQIEEESIFEINKNSYDLQEIIPTNADMSLYKEQITEERTVDFEITTTENASLPKDEEVVSQEGVNGTKNVLVVKTYQNSEFTSEMILSEEITLDYIPKIVELGTSEFLANLNVHIGDTLYLNTSTSLSQSEDTSTNILFEISKYMDVTLLELVSEDVCKVSFDGNEGYMNTSTLTSSYKTSGIVEKNRIQRIMLGVDSQMKINVDSGLTSSDFKTALSSLTYSNSSNIISNYNLFYEMEQQYNINGLFLASVILYEENYSNLTNNTYYNSNYIASNSDFYEYTDNISSTTTYEILSFSELVENTALLLVKDYINPIGVKINTTTYSTGWYYEGSTIYDVSLSYANNNDWDETIYNYMLTMYNNISV